MALQRQPFQALVDAHERAVLGFLRGIVGPDAAPDCAQETFISALRAYDRFDGRHPRAWLLTIARRKAIDHGRAQGRAAIPSEEIELLAGGVGAEPADRSVWEAVAGLGELQRSAVLLRFAADLSYREIGAALDCTEATARRRVSDALAKLRDRLDRMEVIG